MRYHELFETPIGDLETYNMSVRGTFPEKDRKLCRITLPMIYLFKK